LVTEGVVSGVELIQAEKALLRAQGEAERLQLRIPELETELASMANKRDTLITEFRSLAQEELNRTLSERTRLSNTEGALFDRVTRTQVRSPVKGTVKQLMVNTIGGVVQPGMDIVSIVPIEDTLLIETRIKPSDIARLHPGQRAMVRLSAYDYALYGGLASELEQIGADAVQDERGESFYLVTVRTRQNFLARDGNTLPIIPGMVAEVDIATGSKTVLDYLLRPIRRVADVALTER
jgi:adhesin transport system membrane fusion protein